MICVGALIKNNDKYLIARRFNVSLSGFWEFPGGKVEKFESDQDALKRELEEELNISAEVKSLFGENLHKYDNGELLLKIYNVEIRNCNFKLNVHDKVEWVKKEELNKYNFAPADIPIVKKLIEE